MTAQNLQDLADVRALIQVYVEGSNGDGDKMRQAFHPDAGSLAPSLLAVTRTGLTPASNDELTNEDHLRDNLQSAARTNASTTRHSSKEDAAGDERLD